MMRLKALSYVMKEARRRNQHTHKKKKHLLVVWQHITNTRTTSKKQKTQHKVTKSTETAAVLLYTTREKHRNVLVCGSRNGDNTIPCTPVYK